MFLFFNRVTCFILNDFKLFQHFVDDGEEGGFGHGTTLDALIDCDNFVELFHLVSLAETIEEEFDFVLKLGRKGVALSGRHSCASASANGDDFLGLGANFFQSLFLLLGIDCTFNESNIKFIEYVLGLKDARMADVEYFSPGLEVIIHDLGEDDRAIFATGEGEPSDAELFLWCFHILAS